MDIRITMALVFGLFLSAPVFAQLEAMEDDTPPDLKGKASAVAESSRSAPKEASTVKTTPSAESSRSVQKEAATVKTTAAVTSSQSVTPVKNVSPLPSAGAVKVSHAPGAIAGQIAAAPSRSGLPPVSAGCGTRIRPFRPLAGSGGNQYRRIQAGSAASQAGVSHYVKPVHLNPGQTQVGTVSQKTSRNVLARHAAQSGKKIVAQAHPAQFQPSVLSYSSHSGVVWTNNNVRSYRTYH